MGETNRENASDEARGRREMSGSKKTTTTTTTTTKKKKTNLLKDATQYNHLS